MKSNLKFDFIVDKENATVHVTREFDATQDLVWQAWTDPAILDKWWAPKPYRTETKSMDFREGGRWLYAMVGPKNDRHWCKADYQSIEPLHLIKCLDAFCDENGKENTVKPRSAWAIHFKEENGLTTVQVILEQASSEDLEMLIKMGFQEGFTLALGNLDELLAEI